MNKKWYYGCIVKHPARDVYLAWDSEGEMMDMDGYSSYEEASEALKRLFKDAEEKEHHEQT